jgi:hypothetical protein
MEAMKRCGGRISGAGLWRALALLAAWVATAPSSARAQGCPVIPDPGPRTGVLNTYFPGIGTAAAGATNVHINANASAGAGANIAVGDMLIVMQMQDADVNSGNTVDYGDGAGGTAGAGQTALNSAGRYEYVISRTAVNVGAGANVNVDIVGAAAGTNGLLFAYRTAAIPAGNGPANGQRTYQVIKVAKFQNVTLAGVTATPWNGLVGGVVAVDASGALTINGTGASADGAGFRGGAGEQLAGQTGLLNTDYRRPSSVAAHAIKGEGIACTPASLSGVGGTRGCPTSTAADVNGDRARGGPGNGGGGGTDGHPDANDENSGGGGGGNGGAGGRGGNSWNSNLTVGGLGGAIFPAIVARLTLGGGGGAGTRNNTPGVATASGGASGAGIVLIRAGNVVAGTGTPTVSAIGGPGFDADNDGGGGGGGGGTVLVVTNSGSLAGIRVLAQGGKGGDSWITQPPGGTPGNRHGPGGGGGGGVYFLSSTPAAASSVAGGASGVTTNILDPYGASGGAGSTNILNNVPITSVPGVVPCITVLRATLAGLRADPTGLVEFVTGDQRGSVAFNVYGTDTETLGGPLVRLNDAPLAAPIPDSMVPIFYRAETASFDSPFLVIEEIERGGHRRLLGPFPVLDPPLREEFERLESRLPEADVREVGPARIALPRTQAGERRRDVARRLRAGDERQASATTASWTSVKLGFSRPGLARVLVSDLLPWGFPSGRIDPSQVHLTSFGRPVAYQVESGPSGEPVALHFVAEELSTDYSGQNVYVLGWGPAAPTGSVPLTRSEFPRTLGMVRVETNQYYAAYLPQDADPWIWDLVIAGQPSGPWAFDLPGLVPGQAGLIPARVRVVGGSDHVHALTAYVNGVPFGHLVFTGLKAATLTGRLPAQALLPTGNVLTLDYSNPSGPDGPGLVYLDCLDVGVAVTHADVVSPDSIAGFDAVLPALDGVDYLVVTHGLFHAQADAIASLKQADGFKTAVVDVERAYDLFSGGVVEPNAVRSLLAPRVSSHGPRYVLLVGDDTYDPRDYSGTGGISFIPSLVGWDGQFGRVPSENRYADQDGDSRPDLAIGRLPVSTTAEADVLVQKIGAEGSLGGAPPMLAVDNQGLDDLSFHVEAQTIAKYLDARPTWADIAMQGIGPARQALLQSLQAGASTTSYFGHGGQSWWADEHLLGAPDMAALEGSGTLTVALAWTCNSQWYQDHLEPSLGEDLVLVPSGGAAASFGPAGMTSPVLQSALYARVYPNLARGMTLGEAIRRAKADMVKSDAAFTPVAETFNLLGDPALRVPGYTVAQDQKP